MVFVIVVVVVVIVVVIVAVVVVLTFPVKHLEVTRCMHMYTDKCRSIGREKYVYDVPLSSQLPRHIGRHTGHHLWRIYLHFWRVDAGMHGAYHG